MAQFLEDKGEVMRHKDSVKSPGAGGSHDAVKRVNTRLRLYRSTASSSELWMLKMIIICKCSRLTTLSFTNSTQIGMYRFRYVNGFVVGEMSSVRVQSRGGEEGRERRGGDVLTLEPVYLRARAQGKVTFPSLRGPLSGFCPAWLRLHT